MKRLTRHLIAACALLLPLCGCFTGVESTPRIKLPSDYRNDAAAWKVDNPLDSIAPEPIGQWQPGKRFYVTDRRIALAFAPGSSAVELGRGDELTFVGSNRADGVTGEEYIVLTFIDADRGEVYYYRTSPTTPSELPFAIEQKLIDDAKASMQGQRYYIVTSMWYDARGEQTIAGLRHIPVEVIDVVAGNSVYPLRVIFQPQTPDIKGVTVPQEASSVYLTVGSRTSATRNFDTIFATVDPRKRYPNITDDVWKSIIKTRVVPGMTRDECRLALGSPQTSGQRPTTAGMVEYWQYADGMYLIFEEGILSRVSH